MASLTEVMLGFFSLIKTRKEDAVVSYLAEDIVLDDPISGNYSGIDSFRMFAHTERLWLTRINVAIEPIHHVSTQNGIGVEYRLSISVSGERKDLPVAVAADIGAGQIKSIRIYLSTWTINGHHQGRRPMLPEKPGISLPLPVGKYMEYLAGSDPAAIVDLFADGGYVREPSGQGYTYKGKEELLSFYTQAISGGGIPLKHCNVITDGRTTAVEYYFNEWNGVKFPPEAGIVFYEVDNEGKIMAVTIYDDADPGF